MNARLPFRRKSVEERGRAVYREKVRPLVYPQETGKVVAIDVCTGDYEMATNPRDEVPAEMRLLARRPDAEIWLKSGSASKPSTPSDGCGWTRMASGVVRSLVPILAGWERPR